MPSGKTARPFIRDNKDGTVTVQFQPTEKGLHEMDIKYDGNHIPGWTPFCNYVRNGPKKGLDTQSIVEIYKYKVLA